MGGSAKGMLQNVSTNLFVRFLVTPGENLSLSVKSLSVNSKQFLIKRTCIHIDSSI